MKSFLSAIFFGKNKKDDPMILGSSEQKSMSQQSIFEQSSGPQKYDGSGKLLLYRRFAEAAQKSKLETINSSDEGQKLKP